MTRVAAAGSLMRAARADLPSLVALAGELVRTPSCGGDDYGPVLEVLERWLGDRRLSPARLHDQAGSIVGLTCEIDTGRPGPLWVLNACVDTAPIGDETAWSFSPTVGDVVDGWLRGRGAADSKVGAAMFCHVGQRLARDLIRGESPLAGAVVLLFDADEHTGGFGGVKAYIGSLRDRQIAGVLIGYPGQDHVVVGGRGVYRARVRVGGIAAHSGGRSTDVPNAVIKATRLVNALCSAPLPGPTDTFPLPAKLTVTAIEGGAGFSMVPDSCVVGVDIRLTPSFDASHAFAVLHRVVDEVDVAYPTPRATDIEQVTSWPPYRLGEGEQPAAALLAAANACGLTPVAKVAGPSNIGNYLAGLGIPATAGFGAVYEGLHGHDERVLVASIPVAQATYHRAMLELLTAADCERIDNASPVLD